MNYLEKRQEYLTEFLTREEYRKFSIYMNEKYANVGYVTEKLDDTFEVRIDNTPLTFWEEILPHIRDN